MARGATLRRDLVSVPARFAARPANQCCTYPPTGPGKLDGKPYGTTSSATQPHSRAPPDPTSQPLSTSPPQARPEELRNKEKLVQASRSRMRHRAAPAAIRGNHVDDHTKSPIRGLGLRQRQRRSRRLRVGDQCFPIPMPRSRRY